MQKKSRMQLAEERRLVAELVGRGSDQYVYRDGAFFSLNSDGSYSKMVDSDAEEV